MMIFFIIAAAIIVILLCREAILHKGDFFERAIVGLGRGRRQDYRPWLGILSDGSDGSLPGDPWGTTYNTENNADC